MSSFRKTIPCTRTAAGSYVNGIWVEGTATPFTIEASVQPLRAKEMIMVPEARRNSASYRLYTDTELFTVRPNVTTSPDRVTLFGETYEVLICEPWRNDVISHYKAIVVKL